MTGRPDGGYAGYLSRAAARWPSRVGLRFEGQAWTYAALQAQTETAADRLAGAGITSGSRVALLVDNCPEYLIAQFALARLGAVFVTPNPSWTAPEISRALITSGTTAAVHSDRLEEAAGLVDVAVPVHTLSDIATTRAESIAQSPQAPLYIPFSSGTTGLPKGVVHTEASLCGAVDQLCRHLALSADDRVQIALPLCHIFGATMSAAAFSVGAETTLFRRFDLDASLRHIISERVTVWPLAGAVAHRLAQRDDLRAHDFMSLRFFMWGGSAVPAGLAESITARTGVGFLCSYGMTEAMMVAFNPVDDPQNWQLDSPGYATDGTELRLSARGELEVRGPSVAAGYAGLDSPEFLADNWFRTGDLATIADDGRLRIVDRVKDMLKVSGFQVAPTEVEQALLDHPDVNEVAVVGRSDDRTGEAAVAFVVAKHTGLTRDQLHDWVSTRLASYKRPREYYFVDKLPRTSGGKVCRGDLRARAQLINS